MAKASQNCGFNSHPGALWYGALPRHLSPTLGVGAAMTLCREYDSTNPMKLWVAIFELGEVIIPALWGVAKYEVLPHRFWGPFWLNLAS